MKLLGELFRRRIHTAEYIPQILWGYIVSEVEYVFSEIQMGFRSFNTKSRYSLGPAVVGQSPIRISIAICHIYILLVARSDFSVMAAMESTLHLFTPLVSSSSPEMYR